MQAPSTRSRGGFSFAAQLYADGSADGAVMKVCETDISLEIGHWSLAP
jgi:hypothetical protein